MKQKIDKSWLDLTKRCALVLVLLALGACQDAEQEHHGMNAIVQCIVLRVDVPAGDIALAAPAQRFGMGHGQRRQHCNRHRGSQHTFLQSHSKLL